ncbi:hypothetical protein IPdc08_01535 [archaeon]|nr:hypothetical protein IPdc08_01535 [archaeon]
MEFSYLRSPTKMDILIALRDNNLSSLRDIEKLTCRRSQNLSPALRELTKQGTVERVRRGQYKLSTRGRLIAEKINETLDYLEFLDKNMGFLDSHCIKSLPWQFLKSLDVFTDSKIISNKINPQNLIDFLSEMFNQEDKFILGASPLVTLEWSRVITSAATKGVTVKLITSEYIIDEIFKEEFIENTKAFFYAPNVEWFVNSSLKVGLGVTSHAIILGFFDKERKFDILEWLYSKNKKAIEWGIELYDEIEKGSKKLNVEKRLLHSHA